MELHKVLGSLIDACVDTEKRCKEMFRGMHRNFKGKLCTLNILHLV